jgi:hypothetical protein
MMAVGDGGGGKREENRPTFLCNAGCAFLESFLFGHGLHFLDRHMESGKGRHAAAVISGTGRTSAHSPVTTSGQRSVRARQQDERVSRPPTDERAGAGALAACLHWSTNIGN